MKVTDEMAEAQRAQNAGPGSQLAHGSQVLNPLGLSTLPQITSQTKLFRDTLNRAHEPRHPLFLRLRKKPKAQVPIPQPRTPSSHHCSWALPCPAPCSHQPTLSPTLEQKNLGSPQECCYLGLQKARISCEIPVYVFLLVFLPLFPLPSRGSSLHGLDFKSSFRKLCL